MTKHKGLEQLDQLKKQITGTPQHEGDRQWENVNMRFTDFPKYVGTFSQTAPKPPSPPSLLEMYLGDDLRALQADMEERPEHYTDEQKELLQKLLNKDQAVTTREKDDLLYTMVRPTDTSRQSKALVEKITRAREDEVRDEDIVVELGDGTLVTLAEKSKMDQDRQSWENQDYSPGIYQQKGGKGPSDPPISE